MDGMIRAGKLCEFVEGLVKRYNDEQREKVIWEVWLHRIFDKSYPDFVDSIDPEMWLRDDICLATGVVDPPPRLMLEYLQEKVDPDADCFLAGEDGGVYFYQFY